MEAKEKPGPELRQLEFLARLMDSQFKIPGTNIRFGLDALIGLIPGMGDLSTFAVSGFLLMMMAKNGASGFVLAKMFMNVILDAVIGSIPIIGDLFDVAFKANQRNMQLLQEHYVHGRHKGSAWKLVIPLLILLLLIVAAISWGAISLFRWVFSSNAG